MVTAEQLNAYRIPAVDSLLNTVTLNIDTHKQIKANPHEVTAVQAGAVPITGGTYTGPVTFNSDEVVINPVAGNQAITSTSDLVGFRKNNIRVGISSDNRLVPERWRCYYRCLYV